MTPRGGPTLDFSLFGRYFLDLAVFYPGAFLCLAPLWEHVKAPRRTAVLTAALVTVICLAAAALCAIFELDSNILLLPTLLAAFWLLRWRVGPEVSVSQTAFLFAVSCVMMAVCTLLSAVLNARAEVGNDAPACLVSTSLIKLGLSAVLSSSSGSPPSSGAAGCCRSTGAKPSGSRPGRCPPSTRLSSSSVCRWTRPSCSSTV